MNEIKRQARAAGWRLNLGRMGWALVWFLFGSLTVTAVLWIVPKVWVIERVIAGMSIDQWYGVTMGIGVAMAILGAAAYTWCNRVSLMDSALEIDQRFALRERLSSALWLDENDRESQAGRALIEDATQRAERIDISDAFPFRPDWRALLPLIPIVLLLGLYFVPNAQRTETPELTTVAVEKEQVKIAVEDLKKMIQENEKLLEEKGLAELAQEMQAIAAKLDNEQANPEQVKKEALIKINELRQRLEDEAKKLGDAEDLKKKLDQLKDVTKGPAEQLAKAMSDGDFDAARKAVEDLAKKLAGGELTEQEKLKLAEDLKKLGEELQKMREQHEEAKRQLEEQIKQAQQNGDLKKAAELQNQLDQLKRNDEAMKRMEQMAKKLHECSQCMNPRQRGEMDGQQPADNQEAAQQAAQQALEDLLEEMQTMQADMELMEALQDLEKDLKDCKEQMAGQCEGDCPGGGEEPKWQDWADGDGVGGGKRHLSENETQEYKSRVKAQLQRGETIISGTADGENITGKSLMEAREIVQAEMSKQSDPVADQQLPRSQREHARQYFERLREGK